MSTEFRITSLPEETVAFGYRARALVTMFLKAGPKAFGYPRHAPLIDGGRRSHTIKSAHIMFVPPFLTFVQIDRAVGRAQVTAGGLCYFVGDEGRLPPMAFQFGG
jgi:hypothetical protein